MASANTSSPYGNAGRSQVLRHAWGAKTAATETMLGEKTANLSLEKDSYRDLSVQPPPRSGGAPVAFKESAAPRPRAPFHGLTNRTGIPPTWSKIALISSITMGHAFGAQASLLGTMIQNNMQAQNTKEIVDEAFKRLKDHMFAHIDFLTQNLRNETDLRVIALQEKMDRQEQLYQISIAILIGVFTLSHLVPFFVRRTGRVAEFSAAR